MPEDKSFWLMVKRSVASRCPNCGQGRLFSGYIKHVDECAVCHENFSEIRADDGPAWLTIIIVGHVLAPIMLLTIPNNTWPEWVLTLVWGGAIVALSLLILPKAKALFIALIWRSRQ
jgi:uncharacterized protein (DUF983 family)